MKVFSENTFRRLLKRDVRGVLDAHCSNLIRRFHQAVKTSRLAGSRNVVASQDAILVNRAVSGIARERPRRRLILRRGFGRNRRGVKYQAVWFLPVSSL